MAYSLKAVCGYLGAPPDTVRKWEARYPGLVDGERARNGYRSYSEDDLKRLLAFQALRQEGAPGAEAARKAARAASAPGGGAGPRLAQALDAAAAFDRSRLSRLYRSSVRAWSLEGAFSRLWLPTMAELGERAHGQGGLWIAVEHFATAFLRERVLNDLAEVAGPGKARLALCSPAGDRHELGMLVACCALESAGLRTVYLGADLPLEPLAAALARLSPQGLALTLTTRRQRRELKSALGLLRGRFPRLKVFVCGRESLRHSNLIRESGAVFIGTDLELGVRRVRSELEGAR